MSKLLFVFKTFLFIVIVFAVVSVIRAQATRTWISGVGDDVNPCSRTAPCKTFAGAISKTAAGGEINCIDSGGFGSVTITRSITLDGAGCMASILASGTNGIIINISDAADKEKTVRIRNLAINGAGTTPGLNGIRIISANKVFIENVVIDGFSRDGISVENTGNVQVSIKNAAVRNNGSGVNAKPAETGAAAVSIAASNFEGNSVGVSAEKARITITGGTIAFNHIGVQSRAGSNVALSGVTVTRNTTGLAASGGNIISFKNNTIYENSTDGAPTSSVVQQ